MTFEVFHSQTFDKKLERFPNDFKQWVEKIEDQLVENPYVGDPLGVPWFREKKKDKFRIYYLIYEEFVIVFVVALSTKKTQQETIDEIKRPLPLYKEEIRKIIS